MGIYGGKTWEGSSFIFDKVYNNYAEMLNDIHNIFIGRYIFIKYCDMALTQNTRDGLKNGISPIDENEENWKINWDMDKNVISEPADRKVYRVIFKNGVITPEEIALLNSSLSTETLNSYIAGTYATSSEVINQITGNKVLSTNVINDIVYSGLINNTFSNEQLNNIYSKINFPFKNININEDDETMKVVSFGLKHDNASIGFGNGIYVDTGGLSVGGITLRETNPFSASCCFNIINNHLQDSSDGQNLSAMLRLGYEKNSDKINYVIETPSFLLSTNDFKYNNGYDFDFSNNTITNIYLKAPNTNINCNNKNKNIYTSMTFDIDGITIGKINGEPRVYFRDLVVDFQTSIELKSTLYVASGGRIYVPSATTPDEPINKYQWDEGDHIAEQGTSGIWTYRKWHSGIAECWCDYNLRYMTALPEYNIRYSDVTFPFSFIELPKVFCGNSSTEAKNLNNVNSFVRELTKTSCSLIAESNEDLNIRFDFNFKGKWK